MTPRQDFLGTADGSRDASDQLSRTARVTVLVGDGMIVIAAVGHLDRLTAVTFRQELRESWPVCAGILAVDLSACTYLAVDAVHALQEAWRRPSPARGQLRVIADHPDVVAALENANIPRMRAGSAAHLLRSGTNGRADSSAPGSD
ncbi:hypothetical protein OG474_43670 [Kribbella sp. NBC_01505]|uniref:STAS domain-containing protein n=1 Tax=Kribbella sp. NBC_01505 TaxID=2903580 RepID=UPI00386F7907